MWDNKKWSKEGWILQYGQDFFVSHGSFETTHHFVPGSLYTPDFFLKTKTFIKTPHIHRVSRESLLSFLEMVSEPFEAPEFQNPPFSLFKNQFDEFQKLFRSQKLKKVVPVLFSKSPNILTPGRRAYLIKNLIQKTGGFVYGIWNQKTGILGLTPEYLFKKNQKQIETMALAGTSSANSSDLTLDIKECEEHQIVVQDICEKFKNQSVQISKMYEWKFLNLKHLRTDIIIKNFDSANPLSILHQLHPTSALGGSPQSQAMNFLRKYDQTHIPRKKFGAPFGLYLPTRDAFFVTAIRNIQWDSNSMILGSGCGLTQKSQIQKEWQELKLKRDSTICHLWS